jgi:hypothetical protein
MVDARKERTTVTGILRSPWLWLGVLAILGLTMPFVPVSSPALALEGAVAATIVHVIAAVLFAATATRRPRETLRLAVLGALALGLWAALRFAIEPAILAAIADAIKDSGHDAQTSQIFAIVALETVVNLALMGAAVWGGAVVARLITAPNMLGPVCAIVALIDVWGVLFQGILHQIMAALPEASSKAMASVPAVGAASKAAAAYAIAPVSIGAGDYLFLGLLFAALHLNQMNWRGALKLTTPLIVLALLGVLIGPLPMLPGLLFIGLGVAIPNWKYFDYTREEKFALLYAGLFVIVLTAALYFGVKSVLPPVENAAGRSTPVSRVRPKSAGSP